MAYTAERVARALRELADAQHGRLDPHLAKVCLWISHPQ